MQHQFKVIITLMFKGAGDQIIAELVKSKCKVEPLLNSGPTCGEAYITEEYNLAAILALAVTLETQSPTDTDTVYSLVDDVMKKTGAKAYSVIINSYVGKTSVSLGNVTVHAIVDQGPYRTSGA